MMRGRRRRGRYGRMPLPVKIGQTPKMTAFRPEPQEHGEPVLLEHAELEALRLLDLEDLSQEEAGERMGVSRGTIWRLQKRARAKIALALTEGRRIELVAADTK
jgi:predicted DNA-binding protein (UPF0251 family)